jgi:hypothetical protein
VDKVASKHTIHLNSTSCSDNALLQQQQPTFSDLTFMSNLTDDFISTDFSTNFCANFSTDLCAYFSTDLGAYFPPIFFQQCLC